MKHVLVFVLFCSTVLGLNALDLNLSPDDLRIEQKADGGYHLFIRAKPGIACVLLTETTKDPAMKAANYSYRAKEWNPVNGDEKRMLDGKFLPPESQIWSLVDSTPEPDPVFGTAFHIFIPWVVEFGYEWTRHGEVFLSDGTFINLRTFEKPYGDYSGAFKDNPYMLKFVQAPFSRVESFNERTETIPTENQNLPASELYMEETSEAFSQIAGEGRGIAIYSTGNEDISTKLETILNRAKGKNVDIVICVDSTDSMKDDIDAIKSLIPAMIKKILPEFKSFRLGVVLYKDYFEEYIAKKFGFTSDMDEFTNWLSSIKVQGGRDIPEAVYEALYEAITGFEWESEARMIVLVGDAPPHPLPKGKIEKNTITENALKMGIEVDAIILPH